MTLIRRSPVAAILCLFAGTLCAQSSPEPAPPRSVYVAVLRTGKHARLARTRTWEEAHEAVFTLLRGDHIRIAQDPVRDRLVSEQEFSPQSLARIARDAGATELLQVTIERPLSKWIRIIFTCYNVDAGREWEESADYGGGLNGKDAVSITIERLKARLAPRLGQTCLPREEG